MPLSQVQIIQSLGEDLGWFEKESNWGVAPAALNHLTGRIGEFYAAMTTRGQMALATNQQGYDVVNADNERISVKTVTTSIHVSFNPATFDLVDRVIVLRLNVEDGEASIEEMLDCTADEARSGLRSSGGNYHFFSYSSSRRNRSIQELEVTASARHGAHVVRQYENGSILVDTGGPPETSALPGLLRTDETVLQAVPQEIDRAIIVEFQDTNPVQFALLWQLGAQAPRTLLVGDVKQSIMGFQGADPRLSTTLAAANPQATRPLDRNWRTTPAVMQFVNAMGQGLFGESYTALSPTRKPVEGKALELLVVAKSRAARNYSLPQELVAERIARLLSGGETVTDLQTGEVRAARPSDIALLVCRHKTAASYAEELRLRGVPVRISENGWAGSPVIRAASAALSFAANPADVHSALRLCTLGPDPIPLQDALHLQIEGRLLDEPRLARLAAHSASLLRLPVSTALDAVLVASGLRDWADSMADDGQARADLLRLEADAAAFEKAHRDLKSASGFHGETAKVFIGWLDVQADERDFDRHPDPSENSAEAVAIVTWHASKAREWPIAVVAEFDNHIEERPGTTSARFEALDRIENMQAVLDTARFVHTPGFSAPEAERRFIEDRRADFEANTRNLLYVALTRARDRLILEWPAFLKEREEDEPGAERLFHILEDACSPQLSAEGLVIGGILCPATITHAPELMSFTEVDAARSQRVLRFVAQEPMSPQPLTPWRQRPSQIAQSGPVPVSQRAQLFGGSMTQDLQRHCPWYRAASCLAVLPRAARTRGGAARHHRARPGEPRSGRRTGYRVEGLAGSAGLRRAHVQGARGGADRNRRDAGRKARSLPATEGIGRAAHRDCRALKEQRT